jgi:hypothetical protein
MTPRMGMGSIAGMTQRCCLPMWQPMARTWPEQLGVGCALSAACSVWVMVKAQHG